MIVPRGFATRIPRSTRRRRVVAAVISLTLVAALAACTSSDTPPQTTAARAFLDAVGSGRIADAAALTDRPRAAQAALTATRDGLGASARARFHTTTSTKSGKTASVAFTAQWTLGVHTRPWSYRGHLSLVRQGSRWLVHWAPSTLNPALRTGTHLAVHRTAPTRAPLLDRAGQALFRPTSVVTVGVEPALISNLDRLAAELAGVPALQTTAAQVKSAVAHATHDTDFVPIITLRRDAYEQIRSRIHSLPGTVFQTATEDLTRSATFGQPLLGRVQASGAGNVSGVGGLQQAYNKTLGGTSGLDVRVVDDRTGATTSVLATLTPPRKGSAVHLTIDSRIQQAAENALGAVTKPAAVVAVQPSTGRILADADSAAATYDLGLDGTVPPGSTFKIATWTAAFTRSTELTPATRVACPATTTVDGRVFINENRFSHPPVSTAASFGYSCNTSAIAQAMRMPADAVGDAARSLGVGARWELPVSAYSGKVPTPTGQTEQAADAIGQGRVLVSPLMMALMAGAAATGRAWAPTITMTAPRRATAPNLPIRLVHDMTTLMKTTVDMPGATAHSLASVSGLMGKTGTAEYGNAHPPRTHTWFVGARGDLAFAVFIYDGATNGGSALPVVSRFLRQLG
jgi:cell division protein FtsI/penicillin-binding protein 2